MPVAYRFVVLGLAVLASACAQKPVAPPPAVIAPPPEAPSSQPVATLKTNPEGLALIKDSEGLRLDAYQHLDGWYIGYGHAISSKPGTRITEAEAERLLRDDLAVCESAIQDTVTHPVSSNEFSAMASLCFSIGWQRFASSTVVKKVNAGDREGAAKAFLLWTRGTVNGERVSLPLLQDRRQKEKALFLKP